MNAEKRMDADQIHEVYLRSSSFSACIRVPAWGRLPGSIVNAYCQTWRPRVRSRVTKKKTTEVRTMAAPDATSNQ